MREIGQVKFDSETYTDRNMLLNFNMISPSCLNRNLTFLWGKDSDRFPLLTLTEGQGAIQTKQLLNGGDTQYKWPIAHRLRVTSRVCRLIGNTANIGQGFGTVEVEMEDHWFIYQHTAISPSGIMWRIQNDGVQTSMGRWKYRFQMLTGNKLKTAPASDFAPGAVWALGSSSIPASKSDGNRSNTQSPTWATNQYGYYRFSKHIAGNMGNAVIDIAFETDKAGEEHLWMPYEMKEWELQRRDQIEDDLWFSEYNRDEYGQIHNIDEHTGEVVPKGAGVFEILKGVGNFETFSNMSLGRFDRIISRIFDSRIDETIDELVLYCGKGFAKEFNAAVYRDAALKNYFMTLGEKEVRDNSGDWLQYGRYFNRYKMFNGKVLTMVVSDMFDQGIRARRDREAGKMYKGFPHFSYQGVFLDHSLKSTSEGMQRNIQFVCEAGREYKVGVYKGMADLPASWGLAGNSISDRQDIASYEVLGSSGINFNNPTTSFWMAMEFE